ncbi:Hypothetical protein BN2458_PEG0941 [Helicobacter typhlonius]|uniref:Uncharacterized protein n=1 Tax=Helicobacter typhlonius TaxID=76936 RepID=A0A0S4PXA0_9HELI|nr:Hypothetical protein BN2458_PEG0941 [Helicobacter typhlonius]
MRFYNAFLTNSLESKCFRVLKFVRKAKPKSQNAMRQIRAENGKK